MDDARGGVEAEEVVDGRRELEGALVAVALHRRDPPRVDHARAEDPVGLLLERAGADRVGRGRVPDVGLGLGAGQRADGGDHAPVVLEVVVAVEDVRLAVVDILRGHLDAAVGPLHVLGRGLAVEVTPVGVATPLGVDLREVVVAAPVAGLDDLEDPGAV